MEVDKISARMEEKIVYCRVSITIGLTILN